MIRFASEDIGNAAPQALQLSINARQSYEVLGSPEGELALYQAAAYLATAPKSDAVYLAMKQVAKEIKKSGTQPVPMQVRNAPTGLMQDLGYGAGYVNPHRERVNPVLIEALPEKLRGCKFYQPSENGYEVTVGQRLAERAKIRRELTAEVRPAGGSGRTGSREKRT
jgi:putative ATPase